MIPNIFISSTIEDLHHFRDAIRDTIADLGYNPIMSEYGEVGYLPNTSAEESCYMTMQQCHIAILIVGKRYGSLARNEISVTHNEFRAARERAVPVFCLVDHEVLSYKKIYDANANHQTLQIPGMDKPERTFNLIQEIIDSPVNNGIQPLTNVSDARVRLKYQIAHFFGDLLQTRFDPIKGDIKDILAEIKTLRHELKGEHEGDALKFLKAVRFLLEDNNQYYMHYPSLIKIFYKTTDLAIPVLVESETFEDFIEKATGAKPEIKDLPDDVEVLRSQYTNFAMGAVPEAFRKGEDDTILYTISEEDNHLILNQTAFEVFSSLHEKLREAIESSG